MTLSVIIPVYQVKDSLRRCVESVCCQAIDGVEVILVDDGSTDGSSAICDALAVEYPLIIVVHQQNGGLSAARNTGIESAHGDYLTFVDSDDYLLPDTISTLYNILSDDHDVDILEYSVQMDRRHQGSDGFVFDDRVYRNGREYWVEGRGFAHAYAWNKVFRRQLFAGNRFPEGKVFEDSWFMPCVLRDNPVVRTIPFVGYCYTWNDSGITARADIPQKRSLLEAQLKALDILGIVFAQHEGQHIGSRALAQVYLALLNRQISLYALGEHQIMLSYYRIPYTACSSPVALAKALILNVFGVETLCRFFSLKKQ